MIRYRVISDNVRLGENGIQRVLTLTGFGDDCNQPRVRIELEEDEMTKLCWPATRHTVEIVIRESYANPESYQREDCLEERDREVF